VNQAGEPVDLSRLRGKVVMLTAVYASCPHTCPVILAQAKRVIGELTDEERADLRLVGVTMDPAHDSPEVLADLAGRHGMERPVYNLVTGEPAEVERILDEMGIARTRDPETGVIEHANLFLLLDREGKIAYRLTLGDRQERWLASALRVLLREPPHAG
jgi:protein SCO1/2